MQPQNYRRTGELNSEVKALHPKMQPSTSDYEAGFLEKDGVQYQQLVAWFLLQRAMLKNEKLKKDGQVFEFRMAFEMKAAGKFDDVPLFLEDGGYLIQLKHTVSRKEDQEKKTN